MPVPHIITANDLISGEVVYLTKSGTWARHHRKALVFLDAYLCAKPLAKIERTDATIVGPYIIAVKSANGKPAEPAHFREVFRATGPSNRFIGKQAHV